MFKFFFHAALAIILVLLTVQTSFSDEKSHSEKPVSSGKGWKSSDWWEFIKGVPARDSLHLGMWSLHLDGSGDIFGSGKNNEHNHLIGVQYMGFNAGTFINSHDNRTYSVGLSREVYSRQYTENLRFDAGYKLGLLYGYKDNLPSIKGVSGYAMPVFGLSWRRIGVDLGVVPVGVVTLNLRIDIDRRQSTD